MARIMSGYTYNNFKRTCPICKKRFGMYDPKIWVYKDWKHYYCSWSCMCENERRNKQKYAEEALPVEPPETKGIPGLRAFRKSLGLSQEEFAERCGCCHSQISVFERGLGRVRRSSIKRICEAFGCTEEELMGGAEDES